MSQPGEQVAVAVGVVVTRAGAAAGALPTCGAPDPKSSARITEPTSTTDTRSVGRGSDLRYSTRPRTANKVSMTNHLRRLPLVLLCQGSYVVRLACSTLTMACE